MYEAHELQKQLDQLRAHTDELELARKSASGKDAAHASAIASALEEKELAVQERASALKREENVKQSFHKKSSD